MKVCLLTPEFEASWGGVGTYAYYLATGLRDMAEVHVLTSEHRSAWKDDPALDGITIHSTIAPEKTSRQAGNFRFQLAVRDALPRLIEKHGFDIVHANHAYMSDFFAGPRRAPTEHVLTVHTTLDTQISGTRNAGPESPRHSLERRIVRFRPFLRVLERHYLRQQSSMIFVSKWVRDRTYGRYGIRPERSEVVMNGVDTDLFEPNGQDKDGGIVLPHEGRTILFVGRLLALKGIATLFDALRLLPPDVRLLLAGPGDQTVWRAYASELGLLHGRVQFLGRVPHAHMPTVYHHADAVVLPSFTESCPMAALEAMACGTPLIAADVGGVSEIIREGETGWKFPAGDSQALAERIESVLIDRVSAQRVARRAREWVLRDASVERMVDKTWDFYEQVLEGENT